MALNAARQEPHEPGSDASSLPQISSSSGVGISQVGVGACREALQQECEGGCWVQMSLEDGFNLIDANTSAVAGPQLGVQTGCGCKPDSAPPTCGPNTCLNGGRCLPTLSGARWVLACGEPIF